ncbi:MAG: hypothetical protein NTY56_00435 [Patescibacteria group bacterium]|nr:hypothetical protein [Patescibacteria group bacterium]
MFKERSMNMIALAFRSPDQVAFDFEPGNQPRELPLRSLSPAHTSRFTAWRGRSGRRYVTSSFAAHDGDALSFADSVLIAVDARRSVIAVREAGPWGVEAAVTRWRDEAVAAGATELHVHLIAATPEDRRKAVADLTPVH